MTIGLIVFISLITILAFNMDGMFDRFQLNPKRVYYKREWYRLLTHSFLHADWTHLIVNMFVLFFFGSSVERFLGILESRGYIEFPMLHYLMLYGGSVVAASIYTLIKYRDDPSYNSVGASGAVSAFIFTSIFFTPWEVLYLYFIPVPGILFGILYLIYSQVMSRRKRDNINHDAHFYGAIFGFLYPLLISPQLYVFFFQQLFNP